MNIEPRLTRLEGALSPQEVALLDLPEINKALRTAVSIFLETGEWPKPNPSDCNGPSTGWLQERRKKIPKNWAVGDLSSMLKDERDVFLYKKLIGLINYHCLQKAVHCAHMIDTCIAIKLLLWPSGVDFSADQDPAWRWIVQKKLMWPVVRRRSFEWPRSKTKRVQALHLKSCGLGGKNSSQAASS